MTKSGKTPRKLRKPPPVSENRPITKLKTRTPAKTGKKTEGGYDPNWFRTPYKYKTEEELREKQDKLAKGRAERAAIRMAAKQELRRIAAETKIQRPKQTPEQRADAIRTNSLRYMRKKSAFDKEIGGFPLNINWERRLACKNSLKLYCETYLKPVFFYPWSDDQLECVKRTDTITMTGGMFALAMPRGGGKTAICRGGVLKSTIYGQKRFPFNISATDDKSTQTIQFINVQLSHNPLLHEDFPELCWPIVCLEGTNRTAKGQTFFGELTHPRLESDHIVYPTLTLPAEYVDYYWENDPTSIRFIPEGGLVQSAESSEQGQIFTDVAGFPIAAWSNGQFNPLISPKEVREAGRHGIWVPTNGGVVFKSSGIGGAIRGDAPPNPITLETLRPDLVLLDDVQKDSVADSPLMCEKMIRTIEGAVSGLAGPGKSIDALMPCTVMREDDVADQFINPLIKPDWQGWRGQLVKEWPAGMTDFEITGDTETARKWSEYGELRRKHVNTTQDTNNIYTQFYIKNRKVMDLGFKVSWAERYDRRTEVSAIQNAMNLRFKLGPAFLSEYQNIGRRAVESADMLITADQLAKKITSLKRGECAPTTQVVTAFMDISNEVFFYMVVASDYDYNCQIIDYGTWPEIKIPFFTKDQCESWSMLTSHYFNQYPKDKNKAIRTAGGKIRAPLEAKIYEALSQAVPMLLAKEYPRKDSTGRKMKIQKLGIDTRWGQANEAIKRYIMESGFREVVGCQGQDYPATNRQLEEYEQRDGWLFEHQQHPNVKEPKWVLRPSSDGQFYLSVDVSRAKDFTFARLGTPVGSQGSLTLFKAPSDYHELVSHHICSSEYPEPVAARGIVKNHWKVREGVIYNNDYLDCLSNNMALLSTCGVSLKTIEPTAPPGKLRFSDRRRAKSVERSSPSMAARLLVEKS